jgi:hypothetical protein
LLPVQHNLADYRAEDLFALGHCRDLPGTRQIRGQGEDLGTIRLEDRSRLLPPPTLMRLLDFLAVP